jgi:hypothetical protein
MENKNKPLLERLKEAEVIVDDKDLKKKDIKLPRRARVRKRRAKKGWIGVIEVENGRAFGQKQKVEGSTIKLKDGTYHACSEGETVLWNGKFPVVFQWRNKILNLSAIMDDKDETYGQKYVMARMTGDTIKDKGKGAFTGLIWIVIIALAGYGVAHYLLHWI